MEILKTNLIEYHGNYGKEHFVGCLGGQLQQMYYIIDEIVRRYPNGLKTYIQKKDDGNDKDYFHRANNIRELIQPEHLYPFLAQYLKAMHNEQIQIFIHPLCAKFLHQHDCGLDDLTGLSED